MLTKCFRLPLPHCRWSSLVLCHWSLTARCNFARAGPDPQPGEWGETVCCCVQSYTYPHCLWCPQHCLHSFKCHTKLTLWSTVYLKLSWNAVESSMIFWPQWQLWVVKFLFPNKRGHGCLIILDVSVAFTPPGRQDCRGTQFLAIVPGPEWVCLSGGTGVMAHGALGWLWTL